MKNTNAMVRLLLAALLLVCVAPATGDYIELRDGSVIRGTIVEETRDAVRIRTVVHGITTTVSYNRSLIAHYVIEDGESPDVPAAPDRTTTAPAEKEPEPTGPMVAVIPLHGQIGGLVNGRVQGTFDAALIADALRAAEQAGAELVILDINSPGGYVSEMEEICQALINWQRRLRIVAYPRDAFSAAAIVTLSCREVAVRHDSRIGAAVMVRQNDHGWSAVDAKEASPHHARQRQFMAASGHPYDLVAAMTIQETQLWWSPQHGFTTSEPRADGWTQLVGPQSVLTMTGEEGRRWGVAAAMGSSPYAIATALGMGDTPHIVRFDKVVEDQQRAAQREFDRMRTQFERYFTGLGDLRDSLQAFVNAANANDREAADRIRTQIRQSQGTVMNVGRTIRRMDRSVLARRVDVPEQVIRQIERDAELLSRVRRLVDSNTVDGVNEAVDRFNAVIEGWRQLFGS